MGPIFLRIVYYREGGTETHYFNYVKVLFKNKFLMKCWSREKVTSKCCLRNSCLHQQNLLLAVPAEFAACKTDDSDQALGNKALPAFDTAATYQVIVSNL